jgi:hypothetical protein
MPHRSEQPTLFELTVCDEFEPPLEPALEPAPPTVTLKSDPSRREGNVSPSGPFRRGRVCHSTRSARPVSARSVGLGL